VVSVEGKGSTFWFELPVELCTLDLTPVSKAPGMLASRRMRILVAEDVEINQEVVRAILENAGHYVHMVDNGVDAVRCVQEAAYDVILMDIQMPKLDGIAASKCIRALPLPASGVPIVALTANALPSQADAFRAAGMQGCVCKPFKRADLLGALDQISQMGNPEAIVPDRQSYPTLDELTFGELEKLLGPEMMQAQLRSLADQIVCFLNKATGMNGEHLHSRDAHQLVSTAGLLGFTSLSQSCNTLESAFGSAAGVEEAIRAAQYAAQQALRAIANRSPQVCSPDMATEELRLGPKQTLD